MDEKEMAALLKKVRGNLRVTKVVATRSVKGPRGDHFAGFAANYNSVQDEPAGMGKDLVEMVDTEGVSSNGMTLKEAKVAYYLVARQTDIAAHESALANGSISAQQASDMIRAIKNNYGMLIRRELIGDDVTDASAK